MTSSANPNAANVASGMFGFQDVMKDFYNFEPESDDDEGRAIKRTFQANMVQSAMDSQMAMQQAAQAQSFELDATKQAANLELRNQTQLQKDTFDYGMQKMGAEYEYQSRFAVDEAARNLNAMAAAGDIQQNQTRLESQENRLTQSEAARLILMQLMLKVHKIV